MNDGSNGPLILRGLDDVVAAVPHLMGAELLRTNDLVTIGRRVAIFRDRPGVTSSNVRHTVGGEATDPSTLP